MALGTALSRAGELAQTLGGTEIVKLADKIVAKQKETTEVLLKLARNNKLAFEGAQQRGERAVEALGLAKLRGKKFEEAYLKSTLTDLDQLIKLSDKFATRAGADSVRAQAKEILTLSQGLVKEVKAVQTKAEK